ncbi:hypothetical protein HG536_0D02870 [Torulaspora globosa]|uniref:C2 domain-containing protein n=1 Tax=Torulaspora globosa TaxID=48254 RepID=A0A7G3ZGX9_9SACH|nr:uncharacterized protein HG536_0D02870 [Torulaspora globosa]QLL32765.1 hypothetical protein HG536_0D02870 [Torulaspora globosa]
MSTEVWSGNQGTLCVYVSKARDLPNLNKLDKQNVMLRLRIAHMTRESDTLFRAGQNPVFKYLERFEITPEVRPAMQVEVYCDRKKKAPILIGRCDVDLLNGIRADSKEGYCSWYELKRDRSEFAGTVFIELSFTPSLPHYEEEGRDEEIQRLDASMASRPVPPLPSDQQSDFDTSSGRSEPYSGRYMHASVMREVTPRKHSFPTNQLPELPRSLSSSVGTNQSSDSQTTVSTGVTTASDTKLHFANLRKLREKINVFKNPNNSTNHSNPNTPVDIAALQKAIGVSSINDDTDDDQDNLADRRGSCSSRVSRSSKLEPQPPLPPLPVEKPGTLRNRSPSPTLALPRSREHTSPLRGGNDSPKLPPLPSGSASTSRTTSPRRRPPPVEK